MHTDQKRTPKSQKLFLFENPQAMSLQQLKQKRLALCIDAGEYQGVSLFAMKIYAYLPDTASEKEGFLRVIDEEGEPYYYDARAFIKINTRGNSLSIPLKRAQQTKRKRASIRIAS